MLKTVAAIALLLFCTTFVSGFAFALLLSNVLTPLPSVSFGFVLGFILANWSVARVLEKE